MWCGVTSFGAVWCNAVSVNSPNGQDLDVYNALLPVDQGSSQLKSTLFPVTKHSPLQASINNSCELAQS